jgi:purine-binding chemotaxis protein CheW
MNAPRRRQIDWHEVRNNLAQATAALTATQALSPEQARSVLEQRARMLARVPPAEVAQDEVIEVVTFALADERYGLPARYVREVVRVTDFTPVPRAPSLLTAVINLRGEILPIFDLGQLFGIQQRGPTDASRVIIVGEQQAEFGVHADAAYEVLTVRTEAVQEPPATIPGSSRRILHGVLSDGLILFDGAVLLRDARLAIDQGDEVGP